MSRMVWKVLLWFVLLLAAGVLAHFMVRHPGYVMVTWGSWMVEITLWAALGALVVTLATIWLIWRLTRGLNPIRLARQYRDRRDRKLARVETEKAVKAWLQGDDDSALTALDKVIKAGGSERLPRVLTLLPAQNGGQWEDRLNRFMELDPDLSVVGWALQADQLWQAGDRTAFLAGIDRHPELLEVKRLRHRYWRALIEGDRAEEALISVGATPALNPSDRERWQQEAGLALIKQCLDNDQPDFTRLKTIPRKVRQQPALIAAEVRCLARHEKLDDAFKLLKKTLDSRPTDELVALLVECPFDASQALKLAEHLEGRHQRSATLSWVLGVLCERQSLWGKAEDYLNEAWQQDDRADIGLALARLYESRHQTEKAQSIYKTLAFRTEGSSDFG